MKFIFGALVALSVTCSLTTAALAANDCLLFDGPDMTGKQIALNGSATDHGQFGSPDLDRDAPAGFKSLWIRDGFALQTFLQSNFHQLSLSGLGLYDTSDAPNDSTYIKSNGGYYKNLTYPWSSEAIASARCHVSAKHMPVTVGGLATDAYNVDFYNGSDFAYSSGDREWSLDVSIRETLVSGMPVVAIQHIYKQFPMTNGGPSQNKTTTRAFTLNLASGEITLDNLSDRFPGQTVLPVGTTPESALAYDSALGQISKILDLYLQFSPAKGELKNLAALIKSLTLAPMTR